MKTARISIDSLKSILGTLNLLDATRVCSRAVADLERAIAQAKRPSPKKKAATKAKRQRVAKKKADKRQETAAIRAEVEKRADGHCECGCGRALRGGWAQRGEMDHFFPKGRTPQSVSSCWFVASVCHLAKTHNTPSRVVWLERFMAHARKHGYWAEVTRVHDEIEAEALVSEAAQASGVGA